MKAKIKAIFNHFSRLKQAFQAAFGVPEVLFLAGFGAFCYGLSGIWSIFGALTVGGAVLMLVALLAVMSARAGGS